MAEIIKKTAITDTMRAMKCGEVIDVKARDARAYTVRSAASRLRKDGYDFSCTEAKLPFGVIRVTRLN